MQHTQQMRNASGHDAVPESSAEFAAAVIAGLSARSKAIAPKYFYDAAGSALFEAICLTPEYYPTRTETALLRQIAPAIAAELPQGAVLVEFGSGASDKTRLLLDAAPAIEVYVPIDVSDSALDKATTQLSQAYPDLRIVPVVGDFSAGIHLPPEVAGRARIGFFPGSTIGNFARADAVRFLRSAHDLLGERSRFIVGVDMVKDAATLVAAYDDAQGVTAQFNKNLLQRINRELHGDFDLDAFDHRAVWNAAESRMEMHLVSRFDQIVSAARRTFAFRSGERLHTENSHKFTPESFAALAAEAGWSVTGKWISAAPEFAIFELGTSDVTSPSQ